jgi:hypothetical protein
VEPCWCWQWQEAPWTLIAGAGAERSRPADCLSWEAGFMPPTDCQWVSSGAARACMIDVFPRDERCCRLFHNGDLTFALAGWCLLGRGVGGLEGPRAGVDGLWCLCCGDVVGGPFAGGLPLVFQRSPSLLVRWVDAWGCCGGRTSAWASSGRGQLQQACWFTAV